MWDLSSLRTEPTSPALKVQSVNHWTTREVPSNSFATGCHSFQPALLPSERHVAEKAFTAWLLSTSPALSLVPPGLEFLVWPCWKLAFRLYHAASCPHVSAHTAPSAWNNLPLSSLSGWLLFFKAHLNSPSSKKWYLELPFLHWAQSPPSLPTLLQSPGWGSIYLLVVYFSVCLCWTARGKECLYITSSTSPDTWMRLHKYLLREWMAAAPSLPSISGLEPEFRSGYKIVYKSAVSVAQKQCFLSQGLVEGTLLTSDTCINVRDGLMVQAVTHPPYLLTTAAAGSPGSHRHFFQLSHLLAFQVT